MPEIHVDKLFVYGTLREGFPRHYLIQDEVELIAQIMVPGALRNYKDMFPVWDPNEYGHMTMGELYRITGDKDQLLDVLDKVEGHPNLFERRIVEAVLVNEEEFDEDGNEVEEWFEAWAYHGRAVELMSSPIIQDGVWAIGKE